MDALTLTPAYGGGGAEAQDGGGGGENSKGKAATEKPGAVGGGASTMSSGGGMRMAYWEKKRRRRTLSAQLVFPVQPPENTENIDQPDPSLCGEFCVSSVLVFLPASCGECRLSRTDRQTPFAGEIKCLKSAIWAIE